MIKEITEIKDNKLVKFAQDVMGVWDDKENIRKLFADKLTDPEFQFFVSLGITLGANPFKREIWAVKYDASRPAQIFCGRDFYRRKAQEQKNYLRHYANAVCENDEYYVEDGLPVHKYKLKDRGKLLLAYCLVYKKDNKEPFFIEVDFDEYNQGQSNWKTKPKTMLKKVAEAQGLRAAFQGVFAGTYDESEENPLDNSMAIPEATTADVLNDRLGIKKEENGNGEETTQEPEATNQSEDDVDQATKDQAERDEKIEHLKQLAERDKTSVQKMCGLMPSQLMELDKEKFDKIYAEQAF